MAELNELSMQIIKMNKQSFDIAYPKSKGYFVRMCPWSGEEGVWALEVYKRLPAGYYCVLEDSPKDIPLGYDLYNQYLFFPDESGSGKISSVALYGANLAIEYGAIQESHQAMGLPVKKVYYDTEGKQDFLDIYFEDYVIDLKKFLRDYFDNEK